MARRKRATRTTAVGDSKIPLQIPARKPRDLVIRAASTGQVKLGTIRHGKSTRAIRRADKIAMNKAIFSDPKE